MKKSKKLMALLAGVLTASILFTGCGGTQQEAMKNTEEQPKTEQKSAYPEKEVIFVCPWPAGGSSDLIVRTLSKGLDGIFTKPVVVVNREGANGIIATSGLTSTPADGYTISSGTNGLFTTSPLTQEGVNYSIENFDFLVGVTNEPIVISVPAGSPYQTFEDLVKASQEQNVTIRYGNSGIGGIPQLTLAYLFQLADINAQPIPFKGTAPAITAAIGGHVDAVASHPGEVIEHAKAGTLRPLAISSPERAAVFPDMPTMKELGYDIDMGVRKFVFAPKGMPEDVRVTLVEALTEVANSAEFKKTMEDAGLIHDVMTGEEVKKYLEEQLPIMKDLIEKMPKQ
ncbi:tripartite tricarboxylate transporter substrate binding protein [Desulfitobacterium chlororespirans]|uniref:Tripartite-type tricarboxylate transporter, receptor component TctC n=1 Tax=Desulfitobacterium chlororespirans DSM 11544 TaxID=1121395 RepID=A0A1M7UQY5_9FIRM|nr:tripartite tricarboxylate transporter substrate binding protein [Desulfitobacterium chlororespirans]SHN85297.1 Tripartite-type tricarboxylate transporter, receptor component TctC [Desulfitobacterium chlororespirans DSM 11544]